MNAPSLEARARRIGPTAEVKQLDCGTIALQDLDKSVSGSSGSIELRQRQPMAFSNLARNVAPTPYRGWLMNRKRIPRDPQASEPRGQAAHHLGYSLFKSTGKSFGTWDLEGHIAIISTRFGFRCDRNGGHCLPQTGPVSRCCSTNDALWLIGL